MRKLFKTTSVRVLLGMVALCAFALLVVAPPRATAQVPSLNAPYNVDIGQVLNFTNLAGTNATTGATAASPTGTSYSVTPVNYVWQGVTCTLNITKTSGSPSLNWTIRQYDAASASYFTLLSTNIGTGSGPLPAQAIMEVAPAIQITGLPSNFTDVELVLPRVWEVTVTAYGNGLTATGYVGCNLMKG